MVSPIPWIYECQAVLDRLQGGPAIIADTGRRGSLAITFLRAALLRLRLQPFDRVGDVAPQLGGGHVRHRGHNFGLLPRAVRQAAPLAAIAGHMTQPFS